MAVSEQTPYKEYTANGSTNSFPLDFDCDNQDHLIVLVDDIEPVVGTWSLIGGAVVFGTAPGNGKKITIRRNTPFSRNTNYQSYNNSFRPQSVNGDFDRVWLKLQELGVTDWLLRLYVDRLHGEQKNYIDQKDTQLQNNINTLPTYVDQQDAQLQQNIDNLKTHSDQQDVLLQQNIDNLKIYVDDKDDELRAYLLEEIRKQGVALDQLDDYYNYLMQRLAQIAVDKGWDAAFIVDKSGNNQQKLNDSFQSSVPSIAALRTHKKRNNSEFVLVKAYHSGGDPRGGGKFYHVPGSTAADDGIFCIVTNDGERYFKCFSNNTISIYEGGLTGNSTIDEGALLNNLFDKAAAYSTKYNFTWKIKVSGCNTRVLSSVQLNLNLTLVDLVDIFIVSDIPEQANYNKTSGVGLRFFGTSQAASQPESWMKRVFFKVNNVVVHQKDRTKKKVLGVYFDTTKDGHFAGSVFKSLRVSGFDYNLCFSSSNYLMTFKNTVLSDAGVKAMVTSNIIGITGALTNAGEGMRYIGGSVGDSFGAMDINHQMWFTFVGTSFDYMGFSTDTDGWFQLRGDTHLNFVGCHFEAGNVNKQLGKRLFEIFDTKSSVKISGGAMVFGSSNDNEHVFYSHSPTNFRFSIDDTYVWGSGIAKKAWSNTGMGKFNVRGNVATEPSSVQLKGIQAINKTTNKDPQFIKSNLVQAPVDKWYVSNGGDVTQPDPINSSGIVGVFTTTTDENGATVPCLKLSVLKQNQRVRLIIPRKNHSNMTPTARLKYKASKEITTGMWIAFKPIDLGDYNALIPAPNLTRWPADTGFGFDVALTATADTVHTTDFNAFNQVREINTMSTYDYMMIDIAFTTHSGFDFYILGAEVYEVDI